MLAMSTLGAAMIAAAGYAAGALMLSRQRKRVRQLQAMERMFARIRNEIEYRAAPLEDLFILLQGDSALSALNLENCTDLHKLQLPAELSEEQKEFLQPALERLGQQTCEESIRSMIYYQNAAAEYARQEANRLCTAQKMYRQLGLCGGLLTALIIL